VKVREGCRDAGVDGWTKMGLDGRGFENVDWIHLTQQRAQRRVLVNNKTVLIVTAIIIFSSRKGMG
jgi:hypothetical protein